MEGFDNGAIFSLYVAAFAVAQAWFSPGPAALRLGRGVITTAGVALAAGLVAAHVLIGLVQSNITGAAGMGQDRASTAARWTFATQWSLPPRETLRALIPACTDTAWTRRRVVVLGHGRKSPGLGQLLGVVAAGSREATADIVPAFRGRSLHRGAGGPGGGIRACVEPGGGGALTRGAPLGVVLGRGGLSPALRVRPFAVLPVIYALPYFNTIRNPVVLHLFNVALVVSPTASRPGAGMAARPRRVRAGSVPPATWWSGASRWERG
jgi:hypothetical protein